MEFFKKRKDKWTRVYLAGYQQGLHTSYCKNLFCSFDYRTCPNVKSFYDNLEAIQRVRNLHNGSVSDAIYCATCNVPRPCPTIKALEGEQ